MKLKKLPILIAIVLCLTACGMTSKQDSPAELTERQKQILSAVELPTDYHLLSDMQKNTITRIEQMLCYLSDKYGEEFVYVDYIPPEEFQTETMIAYPMQKGAGGGKYLITVKADGSTFTDNYSDFSVTDLADELTEEFLTEQFGEGNYRYFSHPLKSSIEFSEIKNEKFDWRYGAEVGIFLEEQTCSIDHLEEFMVDYAKFLYEHEMSGSHRVDVLQYFPEDESKWLNEGAELYFNYDRLSMGFYTYFAFVHGTTPERCYTVYVKYDLDADFYLAEEFHIGKEYSLEEFFHKYQ